MDIHGRTPDLMPSTEKPHTGHRPRWQAGDWLRLPLARRCDSQERRRSARNIVDEYIGLPVAIVWHEIAGARYERNVATVGAQSRRMAGTGGRPATTPSADERGYAPTHVPQVHIGHVVAVLRSEPCQRDERNQFTVTADARRVTGADQSVACRCYRR